jgi:lipopolysaccharide assembly protein A
MRPGHAIVAKFAAANKGWHHGLLATGCVPRAQATRWSRESSVKYLYMVLIVAFTAMVLLFKFQNLDSVTVSLFSASLALPLSVLVFAIYVLGMLTGGFLVSLLKSWIRGARGPG